MTKSAEVHITKLPEFLMTLSPSAAPQVYGSDSTVTVIYEV